MLRSYGVTRIVGDRYASEWPRERFRAHEITYVVSDKVKSDLYLHLLPLLNSGRIELLDNKRLAVQLLGLERRTSRAGKDSIDHVPGGHDDVANCMAGAAVLAAQAAAHPLPKIVMPAVYSKQAGWWSDPTGSSTRTATQRFYDSGYAYGAAHDPFAREW